MTIMAEREILIGQILTKCLRTVRDRKCGHSCTGGGGGGLCKPCTAINQESETRSGGQWVFSGWVGLPLQE
jgi:hypothetical protein